MDIENIEKAKQLFEEIKEVDLSINLLAHIGYDICLLEKRKTGVGQERVYSLFLSDLERNDICLTIQNMLEAKKTTIEQQIQKL